MKQVTLDDIAQQLSISKYSVSRALSGKSGVSEHTRVSVLSAARELGYQHPALTSREVSQGGNIMLLIPREDLHDSEFWMEVISGAEEEAQRLGFGLISRPLASDTAPAQVSSSQVRGVIIAGSKAREAMNSHLEEGLCATLISYPRPLERLDTVTIGDWEGGFAVGRYLMGLGHRHFAFVTDRPHKPSNAERGRGFRDVLAGHQDLSVENIHIDPDNPSLSFEKAYAGALKRKHPPTALFCSTDGVAFMVIMALNRLGLKVPLDASVVGFNDTVQAMQFVPKLTTLRVPKRHIGAAAMQNLHRQMTEQRLDSPPRRLSFAPEFVLRDSTGPVPA